MLGRRVSAGGRTSAFVAGRAATAADLKLLGGRLLAFFGQHEHRRLTISSAQLEILDGFAGAEHLELRRAIPRGAPRVRPARPPSWPSCASARARGSATSTSTATSSPRSRRWRRSREERARDRRRARAAAPRRGPAGGRGRRSRRPRRRRGGRRRRRCGAGPGRGRAAGRRRTRSRRSTRWPSGSRRWRSSSATSPPELRDYAEGVEADPGALLAIEERLEAIDRLERKHGGSVESVLAHAERCREEIARLEGAEERGAEAEAALAEAEARRARAGRAAERGPRRGRGAAAGAGRGRARAAVDGGRLAGGRAGAAPRRLRRLRPRDGRAAGRAEPRDRGGAAARRRLRRRALAGDAGAQRPRRGRPARGRWSSTRSTPGSAATPPASSASACGRWAQGARSSASPTCRRSPRSPTSISGSRRTSTASRRWPRVERLEGEGVVEEIRRMLGGGSSDEAATATPGSCWRPLEPPAARSPASA